MSLKDEFKISTSPDQRAAVETYGKHNNSLRDEIEQQTQEFLKRGNKIDVRDITDKAEFVPKFTIKGSDDGR